MLSDAELVRAAQGGDAASLGLLLERHRAPLYALAISFIGHGPEAQDAGKSYAGLLTSRGADWAELDADIVITTDAVPGVPAPGVVVADRWGEVHGAWHEPTADRLPSADDLVDWLRYIQQVCPECQGEAY